MNMSKWRLGFYCFCLVAVGLVSHAVNTIPTPAKSSLTLASRGIASEVAIAQDKAYEEEILIVTPLGLIYKRKRYVESIRMYINDSAELKAKIKAKDTEIKKKAREIAALKSQNKAAAHIIALAIQDIKKLDAERSRLKSDMIAVKKMHATEKKALEADIASIKESLKTEKEGRAADIEVRDARINEELALKKEALLALDTANSEHAKVKEQLENDIATLTAQLASQTEAKENALAELEGLKAEFSGLQDELNLTNEELGLAENEIASLELQVAALSDELQNKDKKIEEQDAKITEQETKIATQSTEIETQGAQLADLRIAECEQQKQLKELKKQVTEFEEDKKEIDKVVAALKQEKEEMAERRKKEKAQIAALMEQFTMYAMLANQAPAPQMPVVNQNPLTDSSMVDWNSYMRLAMMNKMWSQPGASPFDFNNGNTQVNSYYYMPKQGMDSFLYHSARNPQNTYWGDIGPSNYFGSELGQGFGLPTGAGQFAPEVPGRNPAYFAF